MVPNSQWGHNHSRRGSTCTSTCTSNRNQDTVPPSTHHANGAAEIAFQWRGLCFFFAVVSFLCNDLMFIAVITPAEVNQSSGSGQAAVGAFPAIVEEQAVPVLIDGGKYDRQELSYHAGSPSYV